MKTLSFLVIPALLTLFPVTSARADETLGDRLVNSTGMHADTGGILTGVYFFYEAYQNFNKKGGDKMGGLTSVALGASTALGAVTFVTRAHADEAPKDPVKEFQKTDDYKLLVQKLGERKARSFVLDMNAGWTVERLYKKYGPIYGVTLAPEKKAARHEDGEAPAQGSEAPAL